MQLDIFSTVFDQSFVSRSQVGVTSLSYSSKLTQKATPKGALLLEAPRPLGTLPTSKHHSELEDNDKQSEKVHTNSERNTTTNGVKEQLRNDSETITITQRQNSGGTTGRK